MIKIFIEIDGQELEVSFQKVTTNKIIKWIADCYVPDEVISINEKDGFPDESSLSVSLGVSTPLVVIYERFLSSFNKHYEELSSGFEPTEENIDIKEQPQPYDPDEIKVRRENFSVFEINRMMTEQNDIDLNPDFQRNLVWDNARKSALIESILLGIPIPVFYFAENKIGKYHVVDGLQRLSTIKQYFNNEFALKKLEHLDKCNGKYYKENKDSAKTKGNALERMYTRRLENAQLIVNVIESASPQKVKFDIFKRLNTGGRPLNRQEVRNCIASHDVRSLLKYCAHSNEFFLATDGSVSDNRMDAQELVLRFIGFRLEKNGILMYTGDMNSFLDDTLDIINELKEVELNRFKSEFLNALIINYQLFGKYCFRKCLSEHLLPNAKKQYINKALFVSWMIETYNLNEKKVKSKVQFESFSNILAKELDNKGKYYTILTTGTSDRQNLKEASNYAKEMLFNNKLI